MNGIVYKGLITRERVWNYYRHGNDKATPLKATVTVNGGLVVPGRIHCFLLILVIIVHSIYLRRICIL